MSVDQQFNIVYEKLQQLLKQYNRVQKENERLRNELQESQSKTASSLEQVELLQQQISILKVSQGNFSEKDRKEFDKRISQYIKEIDQCITFLSE
ncbi:MAG: hypothetical protein H0U44_11290 [Flavisolibacter sp.]|jgi:hypothetical protein|nr:hypothetical protein [Flavisolibacter sp.]